MATWYWWVSTLNRLTSPVSTQQNELEEPAFLCSVENVICKLRVPVQDVASRCNCMWFAGYYNVSPVFANQLVVWQLAVNHVWILRLNCSVRAHQEPHMYKKYSRNAHTFAYTLTFTKWCFFFFISFALQWLHTCTFISFSMDVLTHFFVFFFFLSYFTIIQWVNKPIIQWPNNTTTE